LSESAGLELFLFNAIIGLADELASVVVNVNKALVPVPEAVSVPAVTVVAFTVPLMSNAVVGEEVPIPTREFVTSR
jgi:hypothetical protein